MILWEKVLKETAALLRKRGEALLAAGLERCGMEGRFCARAWDFDACTVVLVAGKDGDVDYLYNRCETIQGALNEVLTAKGCLCTDLLVRLPVPGSPEYLLAGLRRLCAVVERDDGRFPAGSEGAGKV